MERLISFFEIPAANFERAVTFYQKVFNIPLSKECCTNEEKMAFFPDCEGAISFSKHLKPSENGVLISLRVKDIDAVLKIVKENGGSVVIAKAVIDAEGKGYFAVFKDSEGNKIGLHQK